MAQQQKDGSFLNHPLYAITHTKPELPIYSQELNRIPPYKTAHQS